VWWYFLIWEAFCWYFWEVMPAQPAGWWVSQLANVAGREEMWLMWLWPM